jgi:cytochrome c oxidase subunit 2
MQSFAEQLSEVEIAAVVHYERNAWGNDVGDIVQPIDVLNFKQSQ